MDVEKTTLGPTPVRLEVTAKSTRHLAKIILLFRQVKWFALTFADFLQRHQINKKQMESILQLLGLKILPIRKGYTFQKFVSLTFDDGPDPIFTNSILDIFKKAEVSATFFLVGKKAAQHPEIVKRIIADGHVIGNHTYNHLHPYQISSFRAIDDIREGKKIIEAITGAPIIFFRPPHGAIRPCILKEVHRLNQKTILWSISGRDWGSKKNNSKTIYNRIINNLHNGSIILLHDAPSKINRPMETLQALPSIIDSIQQSGYKIVSLPKLMSG